MTTTRNCRINLAMNQRPPPYQGRGLREETNQMLKNQKTGMEVDQNENTPRENRDE